RELARGARHAVRGGGDARAEVNRLHHAVHQRAARARVQRVGCARASSLPALLEPQHAFQVEAIAAALELAKRRVAERIDVRERRSWGTLRPGLAAGRALRAPLRVPAREVLVSSMVAIAWASAGRDSRRGSLRARATRRGKAQPAAQA